MSGLRVAVDREACLGSGMCVGSLPGRFQLDGGRAVVVGDVVGDHDEALLDVADSCPGEAISVHDLVTGELLAPR